MAPQVPAELLPQVLLDAELADLRRGELQQKVIDTLNARLQGSGGPTCVDHGSGRNLTGLGLKNSGWH